ncbi:unnamed protein product [Schistocephalus solidus]|uniref:Reverse transcriptase domain-containing protein n=1 Tax=Schistocephalus solidus TaxID=70667 RepID=A0A183SS19_SCHSO|nr:unnamed protein product [Schistocephalus solidus]
MFSVMLMEAYRDEQPGISIAYRTDGHLLNSRPMQASTHVSTVTVHDLHFADDCALNTVQRSMNLFAAGCADFGLTVSTAKTVVMCRLRQFWIYNQYSQNGCHAPAAMRGIQCSPNQCQRCSTQKRGNLRLSRKHAVTQHENR